MIAPDWRAHLASRQAEIPLSILSEIPGPALTNLLVSYIAKDDLYRIPVPTISDTLAELIHHFVESALSFRSDIVDKNKQIERLLLQFIGLSGWQPSTPLHYTATLIDMTRAGRWDSQYHRPLYIELETAMSANNKLARLVGTVLKGKTVNYSDLGDVPIIRSGDLGNIDTDDRFLRARSSEPIVHLRQGDVLISSIGFGAIGKVQVFDKAGQYGTVSEVTIIRQSRFNPYFLEAFLRSLPGQLQIEQLITGATGQLHLNPKDVEKIYVPVLSDHQQKKFEKMAFELSAVRRRAALHLEYAKKAVELAIDSGSQSAISYLTACKSADHQVVHMESGGA
ncbi:MAG: hypothetical protein ABL894_00870 [Hyphomicrobium sp.]